jgi:hypothetical protein
MTVDTVSETVNLGTSITDVSISPYMRQKLVAFIARNMKPNTIIHAFFDNVNVDQHCCPGIVNSGSPGSYAAQGNPAAIVYGNGVFGATLTSNSSGGLAGVFRIPAQTFRTGDRLFQLTNVSDLQTGASAQITGSKATFTASGVNVTTQSKTLTLQEPVVKFTNSVETVSNVTQVKKWHPDPISQSFTITGLPSNVTGIMLTKVGVYFQAKDATLGCSVFVCEMNNNQPDSTKIIGRAYLTSDNITANPSTPTTETVFTLDYPVFLLNNTDYAFIVEPDGNSPE